MNKTIRFCLVLVVSIILEITYFNFDFFEYYFDNNLETNITYSLGDSLKVNWSDQNGRTISLYDPNLVFEKIDTYAKSIQLEYTSNQAIPYIDVFYTISENQNFNSDMLITSKPPVDSVLILRLDKKIHNLRIDLGDEAGVELSDFKLTINPAHFQVNLSRILTFPIMYLIGMLLFKLQQSPEYYIKSNE